MDALLQAAEALVEDAELIDGDYWGYLVAVSKLDALKLAIAQAKEGSDA